MIHIKTEIHTNMCKQNVANDMADLHREKGLMIAKVQYLPSSVPSPAFWARPASRTCPFSVAAILNVSAKRIGTSKWWWGEGTGREEKTRILYFFSSLLSLTYLLDAFLNTVTLFSQCKLNVNANKLIEKGMEWSRSKILVSNHGHNCTSISKHVCDVLGKFGAISGTYHNPPFSKPWHGRGPNSGQQSRHADRQLHLLFRFPTKSTAPLYVSYISFPVATCCFLSFGKVAKPSAD